MLKKDIKNYQKYNIIIYSLFWTIIFTQSYYTDNLWFHDQTEFSFSEISSFIMYLLASIMFYQYNKGLGILNLVLSLEEINYGQVFFSDLSVNQLNNDDLQFSLHTQIFNSDIFYDYLFLDKIVVFFIFIYPIIKYYNTKRIQILIPFLFYSLHFIVVENFFTLGETEEVIELLIASTMLYFSIIFYYQKSSYKILDLYIIKLYKIPYVIYYKSDNKGIYGKTHHNYFIELFGIKQIKFFNK